MSIGKVGFVGLPNNRYIKLELIHQNIKTNLRDFHSGHEYKEYNGRHTASSVFSG
jgi:hypothetical protein